MKLLNDVKQFKAITAWLKKWAAKETKGRVAFNNLYYEDGKVIATNGKTIIIRDDVYLGYDTPAYIGVYNDQIVKLDINDKYPNWKDFFDKFGNVKIPTNFKEKSFLRDTGFIKFCAMNMIPFCIDFIPSYLFDKTIEYKGCEENDTSVYKKPHYFYSPAYKTYIVAMPMFLDDK